MLSKKKKVLAGILSFMLVAMSGSQMVSAANNEIQPKGPITYCNKCGTTTSHIIVGEESSLNYYSYEPCIHGKPGMRDKYGIYWEYTVYRCTMCGSEQRIGAHEVRVYLGCVK